MDLTTLQRLLGAITGVRVACVGDLVVDRYVHGEVTRVSPEAPIPVLERRSEDRMLGAVGNVARNVASLGGAAALAGVVGDDAASHEATALAGSCKGVEAHLVTQRGRATSVKTRFVAGGQQLLRVDHEDVGAIDRETGSRFAGAVSDAVHGAGAILLSDYGKGAVTPEIIALTLSAAEQSGAILIVDSKAKSFAAYGRAAIVKPNAAELGRAVDMPTSTDAEVEAALGRALELCEAKAILVTRAAKGMSLGERGKPVRHFRGVPRQVFDVSGAGDTALASLGLALAAGAAIDEAIRFAILASGVVVEKAGAAVTTPDELMEAMLAARFSSTEAKLATPARMAEKVAEWRARGLKVGFTNGCFDILHRGHVAYLAQARAWCDRLIVGLNSDRSVKALKGEGRPVNDLESRALVLAGLESVDLVAPFDEDTPIALIEAARPDVLVKGADYTVEGVVGGDFVQSYGGEVRLAPLVDGYSTSAAIARITANTVETA